MIRTIVYVGNDIAELQKEITVPFPLVSGMYVMAGEPAGWNHLRVCSVMWDTGASVLKCDCDWADEPGDSWSSEAIARMREDK